MKNIPQNILDQVSAAMSLEDDAKFKYGDGPSATEIKAMLQNFYHEAGIDIDAYTKELDKFRTKVDYSGLRKKYGDLNQIVMVGISRQELFPIWSMLLDGLYKPKGTDLASMVDSITKFGYETDWPAWISNKHDILISKLLNLSGEGFDEMYKKLCKVVQKERIDEIIVAHRVKR